ncbi:MAG: non-canonical purine NTP pyrophosphatase [Acidobacteriota bacterium]
MTAPDGDALRSAFVLVTGNANKAKEAERILGFRPDTEPVDLPELQSLDLQVVLDAKAKEAWSRLERPVVVEETAFYLDSMNGFPGPLVKWMLGAVGPEGLAHTALALGDPGATAVCALAYCDGGRLVSARGETRGHLVAEPRGGAGFGWDPVFVPEGHTRTYAELEPELKDTLGHRGRAWRAFRGALVEAGIVD